MDYPKTFEEYLESLYETGNYYENLRLYEEQHKNAVDNGYLEDDDVGF